MFCTVLSAAVRGMGVDLISVQVDISNGLPVFQMEGYLSGEVEEARERVRARRYQKTKVIVEDLYLELDIVYIIQYKKEPTLQRRAFCRMP